MKKYNLPTHLLPNLNKSEKPLGKVSGHKVVPSRVGVRFRVSWQTFSRPDLWRSQSEKIFLNSGLLSDTLVSVYPYTEEVYGTRHRHPLQETSSHLVFRGVHPGTTTYVELLCAKTGPGESHSEPYDLLHSRTEVPSIQGVCMTSNRGVKTRVETCGRRRLQERGGQPLADGEGIPGISYRGTYQCTGMTAYEPR